MSDDLILVVEDDPGQREQLAGFLESLGVATLQAGDAETALDLLERERVDLVERPVEVARDEGPYPLGRKSLLNAGHLLDLGLWRDHANHGNNEKTGD